MSGETRSRFDPTVEEMRESVRVTNERCQRLALRIGAAEKAIRDGAPDVAVLAILAGKADN